MDIWSVHCSIVLLTASFNNQCWTFIGSDADKLFMIYGYDVEQQLLLLAFVVVAGEKSVTNWGWFM
jgi:hypothetical protein